MSRSYVRIEDYPHITNLADAHGLYALLQDYLVWLRERNYADETVRGRELFLTMLLEWCGQRGLHRPGEITKPILERYQRYLFHYRKKDGNPLSFNSQYNRVVALRLWFKWLARQNHIAANPAADLDLPRLIKRLPRAVLSEREAELVIAQPDISDVIGLRDRAILETLYSTGIRRMEVANLYVQDIDGERGTLMIRQGKGKKDRVVPIGERAGLWVDKYLHEARPELLCGQDDGVLFLDRYGERIRIDALTNLARAYIERAHIGKKGACHLFRHTMATLMLENGADVRFIQAMLGHACLSTTEIYTRVSIKKLKEVHTLTHPARATRTKTVDWDDEPPASVEDLLDALEAEGDEEKASTERRERED